MTGLLFMNISSGGIFYDFNHDFKYILDDNFIYKACKNRINHFNYFSLLFTHIPLIRLPFISLNIPYPFIIPEVKLASIDYPFVRIILPAPYLISSLKHPILLTFYLQIWSIDLQFYWNRYSRMEDLSVWNIHYKEFQIH